MDGADERLRHLLGERRVAALDESLSDAVMELGSGVDGEHRRDDTVGHRSVTAAGEAVARGWPACANVDGSGASVVTSSTMRSSSRRAMHSAPPSRWCASPASSASACARAAANSSVSGAVSAVLSRAAAQVDTRWVSCDSTPRLTLAATADCAAEGVICTGDGRALSASVSATGDGTAVAGEDYTATSVTLAFAPGETEKTVPVPVLNDGHDEGEETFTLTLSNPSGGNS